MGSIEERRLERRRTALEELRSHRVGILIQIVDRLEVMDLSVQEIDAILRTCGFDEDCAMKFATSIIIEKEKGRIKADTQFIPGGGRDI